MLGIPDLKLFLETFDKLILNVGLLVIARD
jgi:hypothetical protein